MKSEHIKLSNLTRESNGYFSISPVLPNEVKGVTLELFSIKGEYKFDVRSNPSIYDTYFILKGEADILLGSEKCSFQENFIVRPAYNKDYRIKVGLKQEVHFFRIGVYITEEDIHYINENSDNHSSIFMSAIADCPVYREVIKSDKTQNRMVLPEGLVPRFCMGSVETEGPDEVGEHKHPMLDQLFFGLENCDCSCVADENEEVLIENMLLHIPLGREHSVSVKGGNKLSYLWLDFFLSLEGQKYMSEQHQMEDL